MDRNPDYSFHLLEEQSTNIVDNLLANMVGLQKSSFKKKRHKICSHIYCKELMRGLIQGMDQSRDNSNSNNLLSLQLEKSEFNIF